MRGFRHSLILSALIGSLALPSSALALQTTVWSFLDNTVTGDWTVTNLNRPTPTEEGLHITASQDGYMLRSTDDLTHPIDAVTFSVISPRPVEALFLWHPRGTADEVIGFVPFTIPASSEPQNINVTGNGLAGWDAKADRIGFRVPAGTDIVLQGIGIHRWNPYEKAWEFMKGFWTFDTQSPYSINFLWGPLISTNPVTRATLYELSPPRARSGVWVFYGVIGIAIVLAAVWYALNRSQDPEGAKRRSVLLVLGVIAGSWVVFDARMSAEYWSYVLHDWRTFVSQPVGSRVLRNHINLEDILVQSRELLVGKTSYGLVTDMRQIVSIARYGTYPAEPLFSDTVPEGTTDWLVFQEDGVRVDDQGRLTLDGEALTGPGEIVKRFDDRSFFFRVTP
jgi:hypothetical protein